MSASTQVAIASTGNAAGTTSCSALKSSSTAIKEIVAYMRCSPDLATIQGTGSNRFLSFKLSTPAGTTSKGKIQ